MTAFIAHFPTFSYLSHTSHILGTWAMLFLIVAGCLTLAYIRANRGL